MKLSSVSKGIDRLVSTLAPVWGTRRMLARATLAQIEEISGNASGYEGGKVNRLTQPWKPGMVNENAIARGNLQNLRARSWDLYRENPHAKKIVRSLEAKVIGRGHRPQSQALAADGEPHTDFRRRAAELWDAITEEIDVRGSPGRGGQSFAELSKVALRSAILSGGVLYQFRTPKDAQAPRGRQRFSVPPPLRFQLVSTDRINEAEHDEKTFYGIELDDEDRRVAYHIFTTHPSDTRRKTTTESTRMPADQMGHLFVGEDIDQYRGVPWFAAALLKMRDTEDYEFSELKAAAMAACVVLGYRLSSGQNDIGPAPPTDWDLTDADGNKITNLSPGMLINLGANGSIDGFDPQRPNANAVEFIAHMLRSQAAGVPGIKGTTLTGDYRRSSFSSERAADNDTWPEIESVQDWFVGGLVQPVYEQVVIAGIASGWFDGVVTADEFNVRRRNFLKAKWEGPVARSINPVDDAEAAMGRIRAGASSPQREAAKLGVNSQEILAEIKQYIQMATGMGIPPDIINQHLGVEQEDDAKDTENATENPADETESDVNDRFLGLSLPN